LYDEADEGVGVDEDVKEAILCCLVLILSVSELYLYMLVDSDLFYPVNGQIARVLVKCDAF